MFDMEAAEFVCSFLECLTVPDGKLQGRPFRLIPWQRELITPFYGEMTEDGRRKYRYLYLEIPKKNGKSGLAAPLGLYHTFADGEMHGEVYCIAADRENAAIVFDSARNMLDMCPSLKRRARVVDSRKTIIDRASGTVFKVMSSEAYSKHGYKPSCVIFDELHAQKDRELWDVMTFGAGAARRQPVWIVLTTAGDDPDRKSIGWEIHEKAAGILAARAGDPDAQDVPTWLPVIYSYQGDDIYNEDNWRAANPSLGITLDIEDIRAEALDAQLSPDTETKFRWLRLNQWREIKSVGWLPLTLWDETEKDFTEDEMAGMTCYLGLDLSATTDLTALTALFPPQEGCPEWRYFVRAWIPEARMLEREKRDHVPFTRWVQQGHIQATEGDAVDYNRVEEEINRLRSRYKVAALGTDQWNSRMLTQRLMQSGLETVEISQTIAGMSPAMHDMEMLMRQGQMTHNHNPVGRWCFGNTRVITDGNENKKPYKKGTERMDTTIATINAVALARQRQSMEVSAYSTRSPRFALF